MARYWEIRESFGERNRGKMGYRMNDDMSEEEKEAFDCGYEKGYEDAMNESTGYGERSPYMGYRHGDDSRYMGERGRSRDSMGRYR